MPSDIQHTYSAYAGAGARSIAPPAISATAAARRNIINSTIVSPKTVAGQRRCSDPTATIRAGSAATENAVEQT
ncbi:hypothetical protein GCM10009712_11790 [Pseudarthrobacter sulfonivorans]